MLTYCNCVDKKKVKSEAFGKSFSVCSKNQGGCGKEINTKFKNNLDSKDMESGEKIKKDADKASTDIDDGMSVFYGLDFDLLDFSLSPKEIEDLTNSLQLDEDGSKELADFFADLD